MGHAMNRWRWRVRRAIERAGPVVVATGVVCALTLGAWIVPVRAISAEAQALAIDNDALLRRPAPAARASSVPLDSKGQLDAFESGFPDQKALGTSYVRLWRLAQRHGVSLKQAEFKLTDAGQDEFQRYAIRVPVTADYPSLRAFVLDALADIPSLALEDMALRREDSKSLLLDAHLGFILFVRRGGV